MFRLIPAFAACLCLAFAGMAAAQMNDKTQIARTLFLEALRANPALAQTDEPRYTALTAFLDPEITKTFRQLGADAQRAKLDEAGRWIAAQIAAPSALPLSIEIAFPGSIRRNEDGTLLLAGNLGKKLDTVTGTLDAITVRAPRQSPAVLIRPVQPFNITSMRPDGAAKAQLEQLADSRQSVMVVARIAVDAMEMPTQQQAIAGGRVEAVTIHEVTAVDRQLATGAPIWTLPSGPAEAGTIARADIERALRIRTRDGAYLDEQQTGIGAITGLLQWRALAALPIDEVIARRLSPDLFWIAFRDFAPRSLQDALIPPNKLTQNRDRFIPTVNDIERRQLEDGVLRVLLPQIAAAMPETPLPVISTVTVPISGYDFDRGGFAVTFRASGWLLGSQYPILADLPDFFTADQAQATTILDRMTAIDGPGRNNLTLQARFGLSVRDVQFVGDGPVRLPRIVPGFDLQSASIHAAARHPDAASLARNKLMDLDPAIYRGPEQPVADRADKEFWAEITEDEGARGEDLIAAAMRAAGDPQEVAQAMNRQGRESDPLATARALTLPDPPVLTGQMSFSDQGRGWSATDFRWTYRSNESGLDAPQIELADTSVLSNLPLDPDQAAAMQAVGGRVQYRAEFEPVTAAIKGGRVSVFVRLTKIALYSTQKDETGLPLLRVVLTPEAAPAAPAPTAPAAPADRPQRVLLDHDFLDLLHMRELGPDLDDATLDRMLLDRMHRELRTQADADLPWGRFFNPLPQRLNRVERAALWPAFRAWQAARAASLPDEAVVRVATNAIQAGCGVLTYASVSQANQFAPGVTAMLEALDYRADAQRNGITLGMLEQVARTVPDRRPVLAETRLSQIGGRPIYQLYRTARHPTAAPCIGQERLDAVTDGFDPANSRTSDAVIVLKRPVMIANERRQVVETRHLARVAEIAFVPAVAAAPGPRSAGTFRIELEVTDSIFYGQDALPQRHMPNPKGQPVRISVAQVAALSVPEPTVADITGLTLDTAAQEMEAALAEAGPQRRVYAQSYSRQIAPTPVPGRGTLPATEAVTDARMRLDLDAGEALLSLSDSRTDTPRIGLGRVKLYDPARLDSDGLAGALIKKYGEPIIAESDRRGGVALNRYVWGFHPAISMPHCLPQLRDAATRTMRDAFVIREDSDRQYFDLAQAMIWPHFDVLTRDGPDLGACQPVVVAEISTHRGQLSLLTWVIDPSALARIGWEEDLAPKSVEDLVEGAADIDL